MAPSAGSGSSNRLFERRTSSAKDQQQQQQQQQNQQGLRVMIPTSSTAPLSHGQQDEFRPLPSSSPRLDTFIPDSQLDFNQLLSQSQQQQSSGNSSDYYARKGSVASTMSANSRTNYYHQQNQSPRTKQEEIHAIAIEGYHDHDQEEDENELIYDRQDEYDRPPTLFGSTSSPRSGGAFSSGPGGSTSSSTTTFDTRPSYGAGLGLGLPFSLSGSTSSHATTTTSPPLPALPLASPSLSAPPSPSLIGAPTQPIPIPPSPRSHGNDLATSRSSSFSRSLESPVVDRSKLIGLGELATPRWANSSLMLGPDRRWPASAAAEDETAAGERRKRRESTEEHMGSQYAEYLDHDQTREEELSSPPFPRPPIRSFLTSSTSSSSIISSSHPLPGLIDFNNLLSSSPASNPPPSHSEEHPSLKRESSAYSLDAISIPSEDEASEPPAALSLGGINLSPSSLNLSNSKRESIGAASSAPTSAGTSWTFGGGANEQQRGRNSITGGVLDPASAYTRGAEALALATSVLSTASPPLSPTSPSSAGVARRDSGSRRTSEGSLVGASSSQSQAKTTSSGGVSPRTSHHRRPSAFSHLPPSPAAPTAPTLLSSSQTAFSNASPVTPVTPSSVPLPPTVPPSPRVSTSTTSSPRVSGGSFGAASTSRSHHAHHHSSPSTIAASILRHTREHGTEETLEVAERDQGTAEALRKLDGLSSPRVSKSFSGVSGGMGSSTNGGGSGRGTPRSRTSSATREDGTTRRRTRSSVGSAASKVGGEDEGMPTPVASGAASSGMPRSPLSPSLPNRSSTSQTSDSAFPSSQTSSIASGSPFKRGSSSSSTFPNSARDSTSGTSLSNSSSIIGRSGSSGAAATTSSGGERKGSYASGMGPSEGKRRSSVSSEASSVQSSTGDLSGRDLRVDWSSPSSNNYTGSSSENLVGEEPSSSSRQIPPVPPIPKDWESYRPSTAGTTGSGFSDKYGGGFTSTSATAGGGGLPSPALSFDPFDSSTSTTRRPSDSSVNLPTSGGGVYGYPQQQRGSAMSLGGAAGFMRGEGVGSGSEDEILSSPPLADRALATDERFIRAPTMELSASTSSIGSTNSTSTPLATKTPTRKWSISGAFGKTASGLTNRASKSAVKESASYTDLLSTAAMSSSSNAKSGGGNHLAPIALNKRMAASTNDIVGLASSTSSSSIGGGQSEYGGARQTTLSMMSRPRTASMSSNSTTRTSAFGSASTATQQYPNQPPPTLVTTSPGRSRSSMLSPRRTPSGIPFFSRKTSGNGNASSPDPTASYDSSNNVPATPVSAQTNFEEKGSGGGGSGGRKSILGLNIFTRGGASKKEKEKEKEKAPPSPRVKRQTFSSGMTSSSGSQKESDEFGRRASVAAKTSSLITRKRGKTLSGSVAEPPPDARPLALPPLQMAALSPSTIKRVDSLSSSISSKSSLAPGGSGSRIPPASSNSSRASVATAKLQESVKANLPPIAGSPSTHVFPSVRDKESSSSSPRTISQQPSPTGTSPPPKSHTPTKIPRYQRPTAAYTAASTDISPRLAVRGSDQPLTHRDSKQPPPIQSKSSRRMSYYGSTPDGNTSSSRHPPASSGGLSSSVSTSNVAGSSSGNDDTMSSTSSSDFGILREPGLSMGEKTLSTRRRMDSEPSQIPRSRSTTTSTFGAGVKNPLDSSASSTRSSVVAGSATQQRASRRQSLLAGEDAKQAAATALSSSTSSRSSTVTARTNPTSSSRPPAGDSAIPSVSGTGLQSRRVLGKASEPPLSSSASSTSISTRRTSALVAGGDANKSARAIASKVGIPARIPKSSTAGALVSPFARDGGTDSGRSSSNSQYAVTEEELRGDEEMSAYVRRQQSKKLAAGVPSETIRKMFEFPDPTDALPPLDARDALSLYGRYLSEYEKEEIREYPQVYFVGPNCEKKMATKDNTTNNFGYDDERGDYLLVPHDHIRFRYEVIDVLGKGSFGQVLQCRDHKTGEMVAIKIIRNKKRFHHQALVEIKVLDNLVKWDPDEKHYVIRMVDSFTFRGHLCIVTELLSINLYELVKANSFAGFTTTLIRRFTSQILGSLILLRHHRVVHCDLKPENILLKHPAKSAIKVIDFGSSCFEHEKVYTYIQSRFYRSPEVILGMNYHMAIDMWSLGCIIAEMYTGYPIFPGENEQEQLSCIMEVMGLPEKYLIDRSSRKRLFFDSTGAPRPVVNSKGRRRRPGTKTLAQVLKSDDELFVDFISKCLTWDPDRRLKPDPALRHPWILAARSRPLSPTVPPTRTSRSSSAAPSGPSSGPSTSTISTPRRKVGSSTTTVATGTPIHAQHTATGAVTAPTQRTRTTSIANAAPAPRLTSFGSLQIPNTSSRYTVKS